MQAIVTKYHGPTESRGPRIVASADGGRVSLPYDHAIGDGEPQYRRAAEALRDRLGWSGELVGGHLPTGGYAFVFLPVVDAEAALADALVGPTSAENARYLAHGTAENLAAAGCRVVRLDR